MLAVFASLVGCGPVLPAVRAAEGARWQRVESAHFRLESNLTNTERLVELAAEFEVLHAALLAIPLLGGVAPEEKITVIVLRNIREYRSVGMADSIAMASSAGVLGPLIVLHGDTGAFEADVVKHEITHVIAGTGLGRLPTWLSEGLASLMETAEYERGRGRVKFGNLSKSLIYAAYRGLYGAKVADAMGDWPDEHRNPYYGTSWLLVHYLVDNHLSAFRNFLLRVREGVPWRVAWARELGIEIASLDETLQEYLRQGRMWVWSVEHAPPAPLAISARELAEPDALAMRAYLQMNHLRQHEAVPPTDLRWARAEADLREALERAPDNARALALAAAWAPQHLPPTLRVDCATAPAPDEFEDVVAACKEAHPAGPGWIEVALHMAADGTRRTYPADPTVDAPELVRCLATAACLIPFSVDRRLLIFRIGE